LAEAKNGRLDVSKAYLETAQRVYPECVVIERAARELASVRQQIPAA
jgi:hypothetical protein